MRLQLSVLISGAVGRRGLMLEGVEVVYGEVVELVRVGLRLFVPQGRS